MARLFLTTLKALIDGLGATIALPIIIFIVALVLGAKPGKAFRAGVVIGIAGILSGDSTSVEWLEMPVYATPLLFLAYAMIGVWARDLDKLRQRLEK